MAIKITATDANSDGTGIDVAGYLADYDTTYTSSFFGFFSDNPGDFSGNHFANSEQPDLTPDTSKQSVVFESGGGSNSIDYNFGTHVVGGDIEAISFGYGLSYDGGSDTFPLTQLDLRISGLGLVNQTGKGSTVNLLLSEAVETDPSIATLTKLLAANEIDFEGSTGDDVFTGYSLNDTISGGGGNDTLGGAGGDDTLDGGAGNDTFVYNGLGADIVSDFAAGDLIRVTGFPTDFDKIDENTTLVNGGQDTRIDFGNGNTLTLTGFTGTLDESDFLFDPPAPEVEVTGKNVVIADNDITPAAADDTDFGSAGIGGTAIRTYTVFNNGTLDLNISDLAVSAGFTIVEGLSAVIAAGGSDTFQIKMDTATGGVTRTGTVSFTTNDADEGAFNFAIKGVVSTSVAQPEIDVLGNNVSIKDGAKSALVTNHTDFGPGIGLDDTPAVRTFTISNAAGAADLTISGATLTGAGFTLLTDLTGTVLEAGESITFDVEIDTSIGGTRSATIKINSNDANEGVYDFVLKGAVGPRNVVGNDVTDDLFLDIGEPARFDGKTGIDTVSYELADAAVVANLASPTGSKGFAAGDLFVSIENLKGSDFNDTLTGDNGDNLLAGGNGNDALNGGNGNDTLEGGTGTDKLNGGAGTDAASYENASAAVRADLAKAANNLGEAKGDTYTAVENLIGSAFDDTLAGNTSVNTLNGGDGSDLLIGNGGIDTLTGGTGVDTFMFNAVKDGGGSTKADATGDIITDFVAGIDKVGISRTAFKIAQDVDLGAGGVNDFAAEYFVSGGGAPSATNQSGVTATKAGHGQFLFNTTTNKLWWDSDGTGKAAAVLLATFNNDIAATDFDLWSQNVTGTAADNNFFAVERSEAFFGLDGVDTVSYVGGNGPVAANLASSSGNTGYAAGDTYNSIENLTGTAFNDTLTGNTGDNILQGGAGADKLNGGTGIDTASYINALAGVTADLLKPANNAGEAQGDTFSAIENLLGSAFDDTLVGSAAVNTIDGNPGDDIIIGNGGIDTLTGALGADTFLFNAIKDGGGSTKAGPSGDVITDFVSGIDKIGISRAGFKIAQDVDLGAAGVLDFAAEYFVSAAGAAPTAANQSGVTATKTGHGQFLFNESTNQLWWDSDGAGKAAAVLLANFNTDIAASDFDLWSQNIKGDTNPDAFVAAGRSEAFFGLDGNDTVSYANGSSAVVANLASPAANTGFAAGDTYNSVENLIGSDFNDTLTGNTGNNTLEGGAGADKLNGGTGLDTASYANAAAGVTANLLKASLNTGGAKGDTYSAIENLLGSAHDDTLVGNASANAIDGGDSADIIAGNGGIDTLTGGAGADHFLFNAVNDGGGATKAGVTATGDRIADFVSGADSIDILRSGFKIAGTVTDIAFAADYFVSDLGDAPLTSTNQSGVATTEAGHGQFLFNETTNQLWWDSDGTGNAKAVLLASFENGEHVLATDFNLI